MKYKQGILFDKADVPEAYGKLSECAGGTGTAKYYWLRDAAKNGVIRSYVVHTSADSKRGMVYVHKADSEEVIAEKSKDLKRKIEMEPVTPEIDDTLLSIQEDLQKLTDTVEYYGDHIGAFEKFLKAFLNGVMLSATLRKGGDEMPAEKFEKLVKAMFKSFKEQPHLTEHMTDDEIMEAANIAVTVMIEQDRPSGGGLQ